MIEGSIPEGLTFDDVLLLPGKSSVLPTDVDTTTHFTRKLTINIPLASAAMDTVTESRLAIGIARQGGIGIIHRNIPIDRQAEEIDRVKRSESGMIVDPVTMRPVESIREALEDGVAPGSPACRRPDRRRTWSASSPTGTCASRETIPVGQLMTKDDLVTVPGGITLEQA